MISKFKKKYLKKNDGFSLMEVMVAIAVLLVGIVGLISLLNFIVVSGRVSADRLIAINLAQEGLEVVHNSRDRSADWASWISDGNYDAELGLLSPAPGAPYVWILKKNPSTYKLNYDSSTGFYGYTMGTVSNFSRKIIISTLSSTEKKITTQVTWSEHGRAHTLSIEGRLRDWRK